MIRGETHSTPARMVSKWRLRLTRRLLVAAAIVAGMVAPVVVFGQAEVASAAASAFTCSGGTATTPTSLPAGTYSSVDVQGVCAVNAGQVTVTGNVTVDANTGALVAAFANNDGGAGTSGLTVDGNISVASGAILILGCKASSFPCVDDPNQANPTLNSPDTVQGSITGNGDTSIIVHDSTIGTDVTETNASPGLTCTPSGTFAALTGNTPTYSDYEDNTISGNLRVTGMKSCWFGALRDNVGGSVTYANNTLADPDASELHTNQIAGNFLCTGNSPVVQWGDSTGGINTVGGFATGECAFGVTQPKPGTNVAPGGIPTLISTPNPSPQGYWMAAADGGVFSFGVPFFGSQSGTAGLQPIVGMAAVPGGQGGYNLAETTGGAPGDGPRAGDCTGISGVTLKQPVVGIAAAPGGNGCWLAAADGGVFAFGSNAPFMGSAGALKLNKPVVGIGALPNNDGYDLVASDGGIFTYGPGAKFYGSMGGKALNQPIVGVAVDPSTGGYWEVASDGGVFSFNAPFLGSMGGKPLNKPIVGIAAAPTGNGYYLVASDGGVFAFGTRRALPGLDGGTQARPAGRGDVPGLTAARRSRFIREHPRRPRRGCSRFGTAGRGPVQPTVGRPASPAASRSSVTSSSAIRPWRNSS